MENSVCCDYCLNNEYDEQLGEYTCTVDMDMDDMERFLFGRQKSCPFFRIDNEYKIVEKQN